jgi:xanthine dehydrogenase accessory factor
VENRIEVLFRGAGDFATGAIRRLHLAGFRVTALELPRPLCVRRWVSYSEAVYERTVTVEGVTAELTEASEVESVLDRNRVALLVDPDAGIRNSKKFEILVDGRMAKKNLGTDMTDAPFVVGLGPGFTAGKDCHAAVETDASHDLGRVIYDGPTAQYRKAAGPVESYLLPFLKTGSPPPNWNWDAILLRSPADGVFIAQADIGDQVVEGQTVGTVEGEPVKALTSGLVRGMIRSGTKVSKGLKLGDVDPVVDMHKLCTISEKANAIGGGVLEACMAYVNGRLPASSQG